MSHTMSDTSIKTDNSQGSRFTFDEPMIECSDLCIPLLTAIDVAAVFEEMADQLTVLSGASAAAYVELRSVNSIKYDEENTRPIFTWNPSKSTIEQNTEEEYYILQQRHQTVLSRRILEGMFSHVNSTRKKFSRMLREAGIDIHSEAGNCQTICTRMQRMATNVVTQLLQGNTFGPVILEVEMERNKYSYMLTQFTKIVEDTDRIRALKLAIRKTKREHVIESEMLKVEMRNIQDKFLEYDFRKNLEDCYARHAGSATVAASKKRHSANEAIVKEKLDDVNLAIHLEERVHLAMTQVIKAKLAEITSKLEYWIVKYEKDFTRMSNELDALVKARRRDLDRMAWLRKMIPAYTTIVMDDRRIKNLEVARRRKIKIELKKAIKIEAWWRGTMVRHRLGPFKEGLVPPAPVVDPKHKGQKDKDKKKK